MIRCCVYVMKRPRLAVDEFLPNSDMYQAISALNFYARREDRVVHAVGLPLNIFKIYALMC